MRPGEVYLAYFPFGDVPGMKLRPVLLLTNSIGTIPEILVAYISSVIPAQVLPSDLLIDPKATEFSSTNLKVRSLYGYISWQPSIVLAWLVILESWTRPPGLW